MKLTYNTELSSDFCGTCTKCIDACPTSAIKLDKVLNATECIAYWNIESKEIPPLTIREKMGDLFFGCDICQEVCPWNRKSVFEKIVSEDQMILDLKWILTSSNKQLLKTLKETPLTRAGANGLKRNAMIVAANKNLEQLEPVIAPYLNHKLLGPLAKWTLSCFKK